MIPNNKLRSITVVLLLGGILVLSAMFLILPKQEFSESENRYLSKRPSVSWESIKDGTYMENISTWLSDHFPLRDFFMGFKTDTEIAAGRKIINNVYIAEDEYLIEVYETPMNTDRIADTFHKFYEKVDTEDLDVHLMLVPTASYILADKLPANAPNSNQMNTANIIYEKSEIPPIDCCTHLSNAAESGQLYYYTDHHWTTYGAYQGYLAYCEMKGLTPVSLNEMTAEMVTDEFYGTIYSKVNDYNHRADEITIYTNPEDVLTVQYMDTEETCDTLYNLDYVSKKDKYSLFLNNLHDFIQITNETAESERELVLIKDSYANSLVPYLAHHYKKIYVFDTRYYKHGMSEFVKDHSGVTDVLLLYNMNTLDTDSGIRGIY